MQSRSIPSVTLYIRITDEKGNDRYERVNRRKPQLNGGVYVTQNPKTDTEEIRG